jgi:hypothetical protein
MSALDSLEKSLDGVFGNKSPVKLPENGKKAIVQWLPWISVILGVLTLWSAYALYNWARVANDVVDYVNELSRLYGGSTVSASRWSIGIWVSLAVVVVTGVIYLAAYPGLKARKKTGWNLLFYAALLNLVYGLVLLFTDYGGVGSFVGYLIGTVIGLWLLFQIRGAYSGAKATSSAATS